MSPDFGVRSGSLKCEDPAVGRAFAPRFKVISRVKKLVWKDSEAAERARIFAPYQVNEELFRKARAEAIFLHCLPAKRGLEVTDGVMESPRSAIFDEAENRLHAQKALLLMLLK